MLVTKLILNGVIAYTVKNTFQKQEFGMFAVQRVDFHNLFYFNFHNTSIFFVY